jgi:hypothetical protein
MIFPNQMQANSIFQNMLEPTNQAQLRGSLLQAQNELNQTISSEGIFPPAKNKLAK